jgi:hypothetical protein
VKWPQYGPSEHCTIEFWPNEGQFSPEKITLLGIDSKLVQYVANFYVTTFYECLAALDTIVADESGMFRNFFEIKH